MVLFNDSPSRHRSLLKVDLNFIAHRWPHLRPHVREAILTLIDGTVRDNECENKPRNNSNQTQQ